MLFFLAHLIPRLSQLFLKAVIGTRSRTPSEAKAGSTSCNCRVASADVEQPDGSIQQLAGCELAAIAWERADQATKTAERERRAIYRAVEEARKESATATPGADAPFVSEGPYRLSSEQAQRVQQWLEKAGVR